MTRDTGLKILVTISYIGMIAVNALANLLPLNGRTTGEVSDAYSNLFAPAGFTFSVWGVIYVLLGGFVLYQWKKTSYFGRNVNEERLKIVRIPFIVTAMANAAWLFCWHYDLIALSTVFMGVLLMTLIYVNNVLRGQKLTKKENVFIRIPFSVYFGWITIATVANITTLLVKWNWDGFGLSDQFWTIAVLLTALAIAISVMIRNRDMAYGAVVIWAYVGIAAKHLESSGWNGQYPFILYTVYASLAVLVIVLLYTGQRLLHRRNRTYLS